MGSSKVFNRIVQFRNNKFLLYAEIFWCHLNLQKQKRKIISTLKETDITGPLRGIGCMMQPHFQNFFSLRRYGLISFVKALKRFYFHKLLTDVSTKLLPISKFVWWRMKMYMFSCLIFVWSVLKIKSANF